MPRDLRRLFIYLKDLRQSAAGCRREHFRWEIGGSEVGENPTSARSGDSPFLSMPHSSREGTCKGRQRSGLSTSRTARGGSRREPPGGKGGGGPAAFVGAARHRRIPGEGAGLGELGFGASDGGSRLA